MGPCPAWKHRNALSLCQANDGPRKALLRGEGLPSTHCIRTQAPSQERRVPPGLEGGAGLGHSAPRQPGHAGCTMSTRALHTSPLERRARQALTTQALSQVLPMTGRGAQGGSGAGPRRAGCAGQRARAEEWGQERRAGRARTKAPLPLGEPSGLQQARGGLGGRPHPHPRPRSRMEGLWFDPRARGQSPQDSAVGFRVEPVLFTAGPGGQGERVVAGLGTGSPTGPALPVTLTSTGRLPRPPRPWSPAPHPTSHTPGTLHLPPHRLLQFELPGSSYQLPEGR